MAGIYQITQKINIPCQVNQINNRIVIQDKYGSKILFVNGHKFSSLETLEIYFDGISTDESIKLVYENSNGMYASYLRAVPFYRPFYLITVLLVGTLFFTIAILVFIKSSDKKPAAYFHWVVVGTAVIMMTTWGNYKSLPLNTGFILRIIFHFSYLVTPVIFLNFILAFPLNKENKYKSLVWVLYVSAIAIASWQIFCFYSTLQGFSSARAELYLLSFNIGRIFIITCILISLIIFVFFYISPNSVEEKKKLKWLLLGYITGPGSFVFLWVIPQAVTGRGLIPEEFIIILMLAIPISFGISIARHHIMDIDLLLNRSFVYSIVIGGLIIIYIALITLSTSLAGYLTEEISTIAAIFIALLFQPVKTKVQRFVDSKFFRINYNYRNAIRTLFDEIADSNNIKILSGKILEEINNLIPVEKAAIISVYQEDELPFVLAVKNVEHDIKDFFPDKSALLINETLAKANSIENPDSIKIAGSGYFEDHGFVIMFPIKSSSDELYADLLLGKKKSGLRYSIEDIDLLSQVTKAAGITFERIILDEKLLKEQFENEKLEEMNRLKSLFVSSVSHEFKTPLTSIKMFAEIIRSKDKLALEKKNEYCGIIEGECNRLTHMIDNVLDIVKIERGIKQYNFREIVLRELVEKALGIMEYQFKMRNFEVKTDLHDSKEIISADGDAVIEVLVNLLSNAIKFSTDKKEIKIRLYKENIREVVSIKDKGLGISEDEIDSIFTPFFRTEDINKKSVSGTGLGLSIVKHVMESHRGSVEVHSIPGKGSCFKLFFPINIVNRV